MIIADTDAQPTLAVKSLERARPFYEEVLGLKPVGPSLPGVQTYLAGRTLLVVYQSAFAGTNQATAVTWALGPRFDEAVAELKAKGVAFERYPIPGATMDGDVHVSGALRIAWFKDPDGNIVNLGNYGD